LFGTFWCFFWSFEFVSNFGFRASNFLFLAAFAPLRESSARRLALVTATTVNSQLSLRFSQKREVRDVGGLHLLRIDAQPLAAVLNL
jgi:hypothetical protein